MSQTGDQSQVKGIFVQMDVINRTEVVVNGSWRRLIQLSSFAQLGTLVLN